MVTNPQSCQLSYHHDSNFSRSACCASFLKPHRQFTWDVERFGQVPMIRLHDLRHMHATILLTGRVPVHVVSQRLGHASAVVTMTVYAHILPGSQREAASMFARLIREAKGA